MATFISHSPAETMSLGERLGRLAKEGMVFALSGELGAGKTQFVKGLAQGLGISARVHSPTFTLVNEYSGGRLKLFHLDLYRLETKDQILSAGIEEYLQPCGVSVIEWAERLGEIAPKNSRNEPFNLAQAARFPGDSRHPPAVPSPLPSDGSGECPSPAGAGEGGSAIAEPGEGCKGRTKPCGQGEVRVSRAAEGKWIMVSIEILNETIRKITYDDPLS